MKPGYLLLFAVSMMFSSCEKKEELNSQGQIVVKGTNMLKVSVMHHTLPLKGINVYLKFNATEFPGTDTSLYEWSSVSNNSGIAVFESLFEGNYFLYAKGLDTNIGQEVMGASGAALNSSTLTNNEAYVTLYVTE